MKSARVVGRFCLFLAPVFVASALFAQTATKGFAPQVGQSGKDVVWVPSPQALVDRMLDMAKVTSKDVVVDLGSGDGRTVITAAKRGAQAIGVEFNPDMVVLSKRNAAAANVGSRATFVQGDFFQTDLTKATVITLFLLRELNLKLRPKLLDLKPGTRVVSNTFTMDNWQPDDRIDTGGECQSWCSAMMWIIPAKVGGTWRLTQGQLNLTQEFQMVSGTLTTGGAVLPISEGRLRGDQITFTAGSTRYTGLVSGSTIQGTSIGAGTSGQWSATRSASGNQVPSRTRVAPRQP
jgi:SAM-dependent methyltransferase